MAYSYTEYLQRDILNQTERSAILFNIAFTMFEFWVSVHGPKDARFVDQSVATKELWIQMARAAVRALYGLEGIWAEEPDANAPPLIFPDKMPKRDREEP